MAYGTLKSDVMQSSTAGTPPQFNDGNGTQIGTLCRAWVNYNISSGSSSIRSSFNVSSVTYVATGVSTVNFTNAMSDANYSTTVSSRPTSDAGYNLAYICPTAISGVYTSSSVTVRTAWSNAAQNPDIVTVAVFR